MQRCVLKAACLGSLMDLRNLVYRGVWAYDRVLAPTRTTLRVWCAARRRFAQGDRWSPVEPLWGNPNLPHLRTIPDPQVWAKRGIRTLRDIMPAGVSLPYAQLSQKFQLPGSMLFRYFQLRHAVRAQFPSRPLLELDPVEAVLSQDDLKKNTFGPLWDPTQD